MARRIIIVGESAKTLKITVTAGSTGRKSPTAPLRLRVEGAIRQVDVNANNHNKDNSITVRAGQHTILDQLPDLQSYSTSAHERPESAPTIRQSDEVTAEIDVQTAYATDTTFAITVTYWIIRVVEE